MNRWTTGFILALGGLAPALCPAQVPWSGPGVQQTGYPVGYPQGPGDPQAWHHQYAPAPGYCPPSGADLTAELLPDDRFCYGTDPGFGLTFHEALANTYFRLDYLLYDIRDGSGTLLGAKTTSTADLTGQDPLNRLPAVDPITGPRSLTSAIIPELGEGSAHSLNGLHALLGIPLVNGALEAEIFTIEQSNAHDTILPYVSQPISGITDTLIGGTTLLNNGVPVDNRMILYSENYNYSMKTNLWGTEANWVLAPFTPNADVEWSPILGFRYLSLKDQLRIAGTDIPDPINDPATILNHEIQSLARNNIFGPQVGLRAVAKMDRLELGSELKLIAGINRISASVHTEQIFSNTETPVTDSDTSTEFAPTLDLSAYAKVHLNDFLAFYIGYELLVGGGFSRSYNNIDYNSPSSITDGPAIRLDQDLEGFWAHGLSLGGELTWR